MKKLFSLSLFLLCFQLSAQDKSPVVRVASGMLRGTLEGQTAVFKGIPFAQPPVGSWRWRPPQPVRQWAGIREATSFGPDCAQAGWGAAPGTIVAGSSEDCLYLNIWTPAKRPTKRLPVMVWIHGGGFTGGSGSSPMNAGHEFAKKGVVLVTFNYRLGRLGFFAHPALSAEFPSEPKGNYGYMDQIAALTWVQKNIAAFGGDPANVTIFGFSAGGVSVQSMLTMPSAQKLFQKAIVHSGGGRDGVLTGRPLATENADAFYPISAESIGQNFATKHGISGSNAAAQLRALPTEAIVDGGQETNGPGGPRIYSGPILDGKLVVATAEAVYEAKKAPKKPLMIGNSSGEIGGPFVSNAETKEALFASFGELANAAKQVYDRLGDKSLDEIRTQLNTDWVWAEPARFTAKHFAAKGVPTYVYQFGYVPETNRKRSPYGASHGSDIPFVFHTLPTRRDAGEASPTESVLAETLNSYWTNFAKTGNPNSKNLPNWKVFHVDNQEIMEISLDGAVQSKPHPTRARLNVVEKAFKNRHKIQTRGI